MDKITPRNFRKGILLLGKSLILFSTLAVYMYMIFTFYPEAIFYSRGNYTLALTYVILLFVLCNAYGCFRVGVLRLKEIVFSYTLAIFISNLISYFVLSLIESKLLVVPPFIYLTLIQGVLGAVLYVLLNRTYFWLYPARKTLVICADTDNDRAILEKFRRIHERYDIRKILYENSDPELIKKNVEEYNTVILGNIDADLRASLMEHCFKERKRLFIVPTMQDILLNNAETAQIDDSLVYLCKNHFLSTEQLIVKRFFDILLSAVSLVVLSPLLLLIAFAIKCEDGGRIFYEQERLTKDGASFMLLKFRSMIEDAEKESGAVRAKKNDVRVTKVGKFIRAVRLDELPQMINILKGEMSLVGPRPERPEIFAQYCKEYPAFVYRLKVKAGLTGYAQIYGKYNTSLQEKLKMDLLYIERRSLFMDFLLLFSSLKVVFMRGKAEGVDNFLQEP